MTKKFDWWDLGFLIIFLPISFYPLIFIEIFEIPKNIFIPPEFASGLIVLSGIVLGFVTAIICMHATISQEIRLSVFFMVLANWVFLLNAAWFIFRFAIADTFPIDAIVWIMCSLVSNFLTATLFFVEHYSVLLRIFGRKQQEHTP